MIVRILRQTTLLLMLLLTGAATPGFALELLGNWTYRQIGGDNQETQSEFQQRYSLGVGPAISFQPTDAITITGGVGYRNTQRDNENGMESVEQISPFGQVSLVNDIFVATLSASSFTTIAGTENSNSYWNATLNSAWDMPLWPNLSLNYGEDYLGVAKSSLFDDSNGKNTNTTVRVDWDLLLADLYYEYAYNEAINAEGAVSSDSTTHYVQLDTGGQFWNNRIGFNLTQEYRRVDNQFYLPETDNGGSLETFFREEIAISAAGFADVLSIPPPPVAPVETVSNTVLIDGRMDSPGVTVVVNEWGQFSIDVSIPQQIDSLYLYLDPSVADPSTPQQNALWRLYVRDASGLAWDPNFDFVRGVYNDFENRYELDLSVSVQPVLAREIMVVMENPGPLDLEFTEVQAFRHVEVGSNNITTAYKTNTSVRYRITPALAAMGSFGYEHSDTERGGLTTDEYDKTSWSGTLQWTPVPYVTPSLGYSEYRQEQTGLPDDVNRLYSVIVSTSPLSTLNVSLGYTRNDRYSDDEKIYTADIYNLYTKALLYPNLSASWILSYSDTQSLMADPFGAGEAFVGTTSLTSRLDVTARLTRYLTANALSNYFSGDNDLYGTSETADASLTLNYRPSELLALQTGYTAFFLDDERSNALRASIELYLVRTHKARLSVLANHIQADETLDNFRMIGSWDISQNLIMTTTGAYSMGEVDNYSFNVSLAFRLL